MINNESTSESNFYKFINLIVDRKRTIFSFVIILTTLSVIVSLIYPKTYRATATFEIGYFHNGITQNYISDSRNMQERLRAMLIHEGEYGPIKDILLPVNKANGVLFIVSEEGSVEEAVSGIEDAFKTFYQMHVDLMEAASDYSMFEKQIRAIVYDQYKRDKKMSKEDINDVVLNAIIEVTNQIGMKHAASNFIEGKSTAEELGGFSPPKIVGKIEALPYPVSPNKRVIVSLTFIVSIFLSLMYVFFSEFLKEVLREEKN